jgi:hypothetical protein
LARPTGWSNPLRINRHSNVSGFGNWTRFDSFTSRVGTGDGVGETVAGSEDKFIGGFGVQVDVAFGRDGSTVRVEIGLERLARLVGVEVRDIS